MGRKGEERESWAGRRGPHGERAPSRPAEGSGWVEPGLHERRREDRDPFLRPRDLGPKGYRRSDERIRDEVCERIGRSGIDAREVEVTVEGGEVTLAGWVEHREDKRALEDLADDVFGVADVHNQLRLHGRERAHGGVELTGSLLTAGSGTTRTGAAMSAQPSPRRAPRRAARKAPDRRH
jgi:hypothetical protein